MAAKDGAVQRNLGLAQLLDRLFEVCQVSRSGRIAAPRVAHRCRGRAQQRLGLAPVRGLKPLVLGQRNPQADHRPIGIAASRPRCAFRAFIVFEWGGR